MKTIDHSVAIIWARQPFMKWANSVSVDGREVSPEYFKKDCTVILIPKYDNAKEAEAYINEIWQDIFDEELQSWDDTQTRWPLGRDRKMFGQWFDVKFHSTVIDSTIAVEKVF